MCNYDLLYNSYVVNQDGRWVERLRRSIPPFKELSKLPTRF